ncbi:hypothetical protein C4579_01430 [Candidatus Microgenomates bacterium]|nr:MAG: hypothetical protein C4579_01430 [Candidatus Microgenomates bacterium]
MKHLKKAVLIVVAIPLFFTLVIAVRSGLITSLFTRTQADAEIAATAFLHTATPTVSPCVATGDCTPTPSPTPTLTPAPTETPTPIPPTATLPPTPTPCPLSIQVEYSEGTYHGQRIIWGAYIEGVWPENPCRRTGIHEQTYSSWYEWQDGPEDGDPGQTPEICFYGNSRRMLPRDPGQATAEPEICNTP